ncbi:hypothetical protein L484_003485 [Morus notabilis]|uniref:Uncharacterized protein n=1 Tax=Morus notabilis TaxID=981085 RepID=W9R3W3_9ROSA|nr:hypothetical protein L484_003485 [Morus notabilis]
MLNSQAQELYTQHEVYAWYTGFNYPQSLREITDHLVKVLCKENGHQPKPHLQAFASSAIAPPTQIYGPYNIFTVSNSRYYEDISMTFCTPPSSSTMPSQDPHSHPDYNSSLF